MDNGGIVLNRFMLLIWIKDTASLSLTQYSLSLQPESPYSTTQHTHNAVTEQGRQMRTS